MEPASLAADSTARPQTGRLLGDVIVELGLADRAQIEAAVAVACETRRRMGDVLIERGLLTQGQLARAVAERSGLPYLDLATLQVDPEAMALLEPAVCQRLRAIPVGFADDGGLLVAMAEPSNLVAVDDVAMITGQQVQPAVVTADDLELLLRRTQGIDDLDAAAVLAPSGPTTNDLRAAADEAPAVRMVRQAVATAVERGASDVHFDPDEIGLTVRMRIDGVLSDGPSIPADIASGVISRLKILAGMDISERRRPQDGRISLDVDGRRIDLRAVTLPLVDGESVVLRILDTGGARLELSGLGFDPRDRDAILIAVRRAQGGILVTGPTGSGKTTTLYAALGEIESRERTVVTIEDPVEYRIRGVKQIQVNPHTDLTFANGLRSIVRADPDVIMVGEIRDAASAQIAVQAAVTGHLVLSTLHTNDAATAITRLVDMGAEPFLVASAISCVIAQRLVRRLCGHCRMAINLPGEIVGADTPTIEVYEAAGCAECGNSGFRGRVGLFEVLTVDPEIRNLTLERAPAATIAASAAAHGMRTLREAGLAKVRAGVTSLAEAARVTGA